jgi:CRP-like cAMP-binding protein
VPARRRKRSFDVQAFLASSGLQRKIVEYPRGAEIFTQGEACSHVLYIQKGTVKLSVLSATGREAVVAMLGAGEFFGEGCLAGQPVRMGTARAVTDSTILLVDKHRMVRMLHKQRGLADRFITHMLARNIRIEERMLHKQRGLADRFITHMLARNIRIEEDLVDQLFNSSEKRLARALLLLARYGKHDRPVRAVPKVSQETLAEMIGTTRSRVNFFMKKFQRLGLIDYKNGLLVHDSLLTVVLRD